jgi:hypothetical protein
MDPTDYITPAQASELAQFRLTAQTIRNWVNRGIEGRRLPALRLGPRKILIQRGQFLDFVAAMQQRPAAASMTAEQSK